MDISSLFNQMLILLIILVVGFIANKTNIIDQQGNKNLSKLTLNITQGAMILSSVMNANPSMSSAELLTLVGVSFLMYVILFIFSFVIRWLLRVPKKDGFTYQFAVMFGNVGFMGYPIVASLLGTEAIFYVSLYNIPFNILIYSLGIFLISGGDGYKFNLKSLANPPFFATFIAIGIFVLKIPIPAPIAGATKLLGDMVIPAAMLVIGSSLGRISLKDILGDWRIYVFLPLSLIVSPVIIWAVLRTFITNPLILNMAVIIAAMPVATNSTMLSMEYNGNEVLASKAVFMTTVASVVTIPLVISLLL
jgi:Predicted permeases